MPGDPGTPQLLGNPGGGFLFERRLIGKTVTRDEKVHLMPRQPHSQRYDDIESHQDLAKEGFRRLMRRRSATKPSMSAFCCRALSNKRFK